MYIPFTEEQNAMREAVRRLVAQELLPLLSSPASCASMSKIMFHSALHTLGAVGLIAPRLPMSEGGAGIKMLDYGILFELIPPQIGISLCLSTSVHQ